MVQWFRNIPRSVMMHSDAVGDQTANPVAAIEVGSTGTRLLVASIDGSGAMKVLDRAGKASRIGRDVFTQGSIGREAIRESMAVLASFKELLAGYGILPGDAKVIGTSALPEMTCPYWGISLATDRMHGPGLARRP